MENWQQLPVKIKQVWRLEVGISLVVGLILAAGMFFAVYFWHWAQWLNYIIVPLTLLDCGIESALIPYRYRFWRYQITASDVEIEAGFFWHKQVAIPISRIQNVTLEAGPLLQLFGLQKVKVETAAAAHEISGVLPKQAELLKKQIMELAQEGEDNDS
ncbi:membrane protein [Ligilactobacillus salitolerans]|uniref:Membrane protein n=1 Tax=Ligilactobacillus salitolerans TaxID=1808352 RepID=A0A401IT95_9LACO|nr:PH domain-containing protein [Ligilactobacillus salitolerans]GBG94770.1 membrane protein [Ligilactobacillus salitolerans]